MSRSEIRAKLCAGKIGIDSSIQAQGSGGVMSQNWRIYCLFDTTLCCANYTCGALCCNLLYCMLAIKSLLALFGGHDMLRKRGH